MNCCYQPIVSIIDYKIQSHFPDDPSISVRTEFCETDKYAKVFLNDNEVDIPEHMKIQVKELFEEFDRDRAIQIIENSILWLYQIHFFDKDCKECYDGNEIIEIEIE